MESVSFQPLSTLTKITEDIKTNDISNVISYVEHNSIKFPINPKNIEINGQLTLLEFIRMSEKMKLIPPNTLSLFLKSCEYEDRNQGFTSDEVCQLLGYENKHLTSALKKDFIIEIDYNVSMPSARHRKNGEKFNPKPKKNYQISINTVKELAIRKDKTVRQYYLTLEQLLKDHVKYQMIFNKGWNNKQLQIKENEFKSQLIIMEKNMTIKHNDEIEKLKKIGFIYYVQEIIPSKEKYDEDFRYIGKTTQTIPERMKEHFGSAMNSLKSGFYKAIFENGGKNFMIDKKLSHSVKYLDEDELDKIETNEIKTYSLYHNNHVGNICKTSSTYKEKRSKSIVVKNSVYEDREFQSDGNDEENKKEPIIKNDLNIIKERAVMKTRAYICTLCSYGHCTSQKNLDIHMFRKHSSFLQISESK